MRQNLGLEIYDSYLKDLNSYVRGCSNFFDQAEWLLNFQPYFRNGENSQAQEALQKSNVDISAKARLSVINLTDAWKALANLQKEFRKILYLFIDIDVLNELEREERLVFDQLWCSWYFFVFHPTQHFNNVIWQTKQEFRNQVRDIKKSLQKELRKISKNGVSASILSDKVSWDTEPSLWLQIDVGNPSDIYSATETLIFAIRRAILAVPESQFRYYAIDLTWSSILIVPLVQGKSLASETWRISSIQFSVDPEKPLEPWNFIPVVIPKETMSELNISTWVHPRLDIAQRFLGSISGLSLLSSHFQDFKRLPEMDDQGHIMLQSYIDQCTNPVNECFQIMIDTETELLKYYNQLSSQEQENRLDLRMAIHSLLELHDEIHFIGNQQNSAKFELSISLIEFSEWVNQLETFQQLILSIYLKWVSDVLMEISLSVTPSI